ncbi:MAG TPA: hypothetical protein P5079_06045 [Elusimicrobiota bacterium]|nr:hypothetical protein [Elusimicrobiota bacterium]
MSREPSPSLLKRIWDRILSWLGLADDAQAGAAAAEQERLTLIVQQHEAELLRLRRLLSDTQSSLQRSEQERNKSLDTLNDREIRLEKEKSRAAVAGVLIKDYDIELKKIRREKLTQQRIFEDKIHALLEKLNELQRSLPTAPSANLPSPVVAKSLALEKQALQQELHETQEKLALLEDKLDRETSARLDVQKQSASLQSGSAELQEKFRAAESALWNEKTKTEALEKEKTVLQKQVMELQKTLEAVKNVDSVQEPASVSQEVIALRERVQALDEALRSARAAAAGGGGGPAPVSDEELSPIPHGVQMELDTLRSALEQERARWEEERLRTEAALEEEKRRADKETRLRRTLEERTTALSRETEKWRSTHEEARKQWEDERKRLLEQWDKEKEHRLEELEMHRQAEDRAGSLLEEIETLRKTLEKERASWANERTDLQQRQERDRREWGERLDRAAKLRGDPGELEEIRKGFEQSRAVWEKERGDLTARWEKEREEWRERLEAAAGSSSAAGGFTATQEEVDRLLGELDALTAENAFLKDQLGWEESKPS